jgi:hypothetical protein
LGDRDDNRMSVKAEWEMRLHAPYHPERGERTA